MPQILLCSLCGQTRATGCAQSQKPYIRGNPSGRKCQVCTLSHTISYALK